MINLFVAALFSLTTLTPIKPAPLPINGFYLPSPALSMDKEQLEKDAALQETIDDLSRQIGSMGHGRTRGRRLRGGIKNSLLAMLYREAIPRLMHYLVRSNGRRGPRQSKIS